MIRKLALIGAFPLRSSPRGGVESANRALVELLLKHNPELEVEVLTSGQGNEVLEQGRLRVYGDLPRDYRFARLRGYPLERLVIKTFIARLEPDTLVHATGPLAAMTFVAARRRGLPTVFTVHGILENDIRFERHLGRWMQQLLIWRLKPMIRAAALSASRVIAISSFGANYLRQLGRQDSIPVIPNPLDQRFEQINHSLHPDGKTIVFVGNVQPLKGLHVLLEALRSIKQQIPTVSLRVAGSVLDEVYASTLKDQARQLGLTDCIQWLGPLDKPALITQLLQSDVLALPSMTENLPQALQEAGYIGLPFVASEVGGVRDFVPDGLQNTVLVEPNDASGLAKKLHALLEHPVRRAEVASLVQTHIRERFSNDRIATQILALYDDATNDIQRPSRPITAQTARDAR
jgi:glycosyltransferase involved in cell wall biosynthesis